MREFIALLREFLSGAKVTFAGDYYYQVRGFRLGVELGGCRRRSRNAAAVGYRRAAEASHPLRQGERS
jgi:hypothetical protein